MSRIKSRWVVCGHEQIMMIQNFNSRKSWTFYETKGKWCYPVIDIISHGNILQKNWYSFSRNQNDIYSQSPLLCQGLSLWNIRSEVVQISPKSKINNRIIILIISIVNKVIASINIASMKPIFTYNLLTNTTLGMGKF